MAALPWHSLAPAWPLLWAKRLQRVKAAAGEGLCQRELGCERGQGMVRAVRMLRNKMRCLMMLVLLDPIQHHSPVSKD